jgi:GT2 family glycosyltransferase
MPEAGVVRVGGVVIGRNEGERLKRCLHSLSGRVSPLVYVDSASSDDSVVFARSLGVEVVQLDLSVPFTAARARNAGFERLLTIDPNIELVWFVDGDCEVVAGFIESARETMRAEPELVALTGTRRERYPEASIYNQLCDIEWQQGPFGEVDRFGGDVMIRARALKAVGGYNPSVISAEDDEVAARLYKAGGKIRRVQETMTLHDASMHELSQWWKRAKRCGHGYAQVGSLHAGPPLNKFENQRKRVIMWGAVLPAAAVLLAPPSLGTSLFLGAVYPLRALRIAQRAEREGLPRRAARAWGLSCTFSQIPEAFGMLKYYADRVRNRAPEIIEYKGPKSR